MARYILTIMERTPEGKFELNKLIEINANSIVEMLSKFPLEIHQLGQLKLSQMMDKVNKDRMKDDDIPF